MYRISVLMLLILAQEYSSKCTVFFGVILFVGVEYNTVIASYSVYKAEML